MMVTVMISTISLDLQSINVVTGFMANIMQINHSNPSIGTSINQSKPGAT